MEHTWGVFGCEGAQGSNGAVATGHAVTARATVVPNIIEEKRIRRPALRKEGKENLREGEDIWMGRGNNRGRPGRQRAGSGGSGGSRVGFETCCRHENVTQGV